MRLSMLRSDVMISAFPERPISYSISSLVVVFSPQGKLISTA